MNESLFGSPITAEDNKIVSQLKKDGVLLKFVLDEVRGKAKNGGVAFVCSDGDIDASLYHRQISHRPHEIKLFGGPLLLAPSYKGFDEVFAKFILANMKSGMMHKRTRYSHLYFHSPCGMAYDLYGYSIPEIISLAREAKDFMLEDSFFLPEKIDLYFHVKRINKAESMEQNSYLLAA
ncbi:MAG: hypothetical protein Q7R92_04785 [bacterium]|nr:hypothetical protein [bacterium]